MSTPMLPTHSLIWRHDQAQTFFSHVQRCAKLPTHSMKFELEVSGHLSLNMAYGCLWQIEQPRRKCGHSYRRAMAMGRSKLRWIRKCRPVGLRKLCTVSWAPGPRSIEVQKMIRRNQIETLKFLQALCDRSQKLLNTHELLRISVIQRVSIGVL